MSFNKFELVSELELALEVRALLSHRRWQTRLQQNCYRTGEECEEFCLRRYLNARLTYTDLFLLDRLLENEGKCYHFHTLPT